MQRMTLNIWEIAVSNLYVHEAQRTPNRCKNLFLPHRMWINLGNEFAAPDVRYTVRRSMLIL